MGSGSSVGAPESRGLPIDGSRTSVRVQSLPRGAGRSEKQEHRSSVDVFTPSSSRDGIGREASRRSARLDYSRPTTHRSTTLTSIYEGPALTEEQESKIKSCLTSLEELLRGSQLRFDIRNILPHAVVMHEEGGGESQLLDRVGEGLFIVDTGSVNLISPNSSPAKEVAVIRLAEGDYCGEYSTLFNVPFRIKVQFKTRWVQMEEFWVHIIFLWCNPLQCWSTTFASGYSASEYALHRTAGQRCHAQPQHHTVSQCTIS